MRLRIKEIIEKEISSSLNIGGDLPIILELNKKDTYEVVLYYEIVTDNDSLFEIEILQNDGRIKSINLINISEKDAEYVSTLSTNLSEAITAEPLIDTTIFPISKPEDYFERFYRVKDFKLFIAENGIEIKLNNSSLTKNIIDVGQQCYLAISDKNEINSFFVNWSSGNQKEQFEKSLIR